MRLCFNYFDKQMLWELEQSGASMLVKKDVDEDFLNVGDDKNLNVCWGSMLMQFLPYIGERKSTLRHGCSPADYFTNMHFHQHPSPTLQQPSFVRNHQNTISPTYF